MMAGIRDQKDTIHAKAEGNSIAQTTAPSSSLTIGTSRRWSGFKNPRIVRVSRTFGGKDRHSKVCTIRGLRDRRIRLSVPTAIQLYDLQDRLGVSQPSKVVDWLLEATKLDIDELPPLHFPDQFHDQYSLLGQFSNNCAPPHRFAPYLDANLTLMNGPPAPIGSSSMKGININDNVDDEDKDGDEDDDQHSLEAKLEKIKWNYNKASINSEEDQYQGGGNFLPSLMNSSTTLPYSQFYNWDPSNLSLAQLGSHGFLGPNSEDSNQLNSGYPGGSSSTQQLFFCPPSMPTTTASLFPQNDTSSAAMSAAFHPSGSGLHSAGVSSSNQLQINKGDQN